MSTARPQKVNANTTPAPLSPDEIRWLDHDHAARSVRRRWPNVTGDELEGRVDWALGFTPGRGKSRPQALARNRRGAFVASERQRGRTLEQVSDRLHAVEGRRYSTRDLIECQKRAAEAEARIDGAAWPKVPKADVRRVLAARDRYRKAQSQLLAVNREILAMLPAEDGCLSPADRVQMFAQMFLDGDTPSAVELRERRLRAVRARNSAAVRYGAKAMRFGLTPVIDEGTDLDRDAIGLAGDLHVSLDQQVGEDGDTALGDLLPSNHKTPEEVAYEDERERIVRRAIASLPDTERTVLTLRFGIGGAEPQSLTAIGKRLGFSAERASQLEQRASEKLAVSPELAALREAA